MVSPWRLRATSVFLIAILGNTLSAQPQPTSDCTRFSGVADGETSTQLSPSKVSFGLGPCSEACLLSSQDALAILERYPSIEDLELWSWPTEPRQTQAFVHSAGQNRHIHQLSLMGMTLDEALLASLSACAHLTRLSIDGRTVLLAESVPEGHHEWIFRALSKCQQLESIRISKHARIDGEGCEHLSTLPQLRQLTLGCTTLSPNGAAGLAKIQTLEQLELPNVELSPENIRLLSQLTRLKRLVLKISTASQADTLGKLTQLTDVTVYATRRAVANTSIARLPKLKRLQFILIDEEGL